MVRQTLFIRAHRICHVSGNTWLSFLVSPCFHIPHISFPLIISMSLALFARNPRSSADIRGPNVVLYLGGPNSGKEPIKKTEWLDPGRYKECIPPLSKNIQATQNILSEPTRSLSDLKFLQLEVPPSLCLRSSPFRPQPGCELRTP